MKKFNKKGFTLTELIVVIVIIGILAAVLIPTLTGYISKANESAATQEASTFVTAFNTWQVEEDDYTVENFEKYCTDLDLLAENQDILHVNVEKGNMVFVIKTSKDYYVTYTNGKLVASKELPENLNNELKVKEFKETVIDVNIDSINDELKNAEGAQLAELAIKPNQNADGSYDVEIIIKDENAFAIDVVEAVKKAIEIIKNHNGKTVIVTPILEGVSMSENEYLAVLQTLDGFSDLTSLKVDLTTESLEGIAIFIAYSIVYENNISVTDWDDNALALVDQEITKLGDLVNKHGFQITATVKESETVSYDVVYNFTFSK